MHCKNHIILAYLTFNEHISECVDVGHRYYQVHIAFSFYTTMNMCSNVNRQEDNMEKYILNAINKIK